MNIFVLDRDVKTCAMYHNDKHTVKMIVETSQLLSSAYYDENKVLQEVKDYPFDNFLKLTHYNHPCSVWVRESLENFLWLNNLLGCLLNEYTYRYHKIHKYDPLNPWFYDNLPKRLKSNGLTEFKLAMPDEIKEKFTDPVEAYRYYYVFYKGHLASWKNRSVPYWYNEILEKYSQ